MPGPSGAEARYGLPYPLLGDTPDAEHDLKELVEKFAAINRGSADILNPGVVSATDWSFNAAIVPGTGELESEGEVPESVAWMKDPIVPADLMRTITPKKAIAKIKPPSLPVAGKFMVVAFELTPSLWGGPATVSLKCGPEKATLAEAESGSATPATSAGKIQVRQVVVENAAGVYSIKFQRDVRPSAPPFRTTGAAGYPGQPEEPFKTRVQNTSYKANPVRTCWVQIWIYWKAKLTEAQSEESVQFTIGDDEHQEAGEYGVGLISAPRPNVNVEQHTSHNFMLPANWFWRAGSCAAIGSLNSTYFPFGG